MSCLLEEDDEVIHDDVRSVALPQESLLNCSLLSTGTPPPLTHYAMNLLGWIEVCCLLDYPHVVASTLVHHPSPIPMKEEMSLLS